MHPSECLRDRVAKKLNPRRASLGHDRLRVGRIATEALRENGAYGRRLESASVACVPIARVSAPP
ncbi:MAG: hypothetical protein HGB34_04250 [Candidatus Moranbacteria bacterium]|nr:hypothetical protein [Candidatus Moranbacteria bacterium]